MGRLLGDERTDSLVNAIDFSFIPIDGSIFNDLVSTLVPSKIPTTKIKRSTIARLQDLFFPSHLYHTLLTDNKNAINHNNINKNKEYFFSIVCVVLSLGD